MKDEEYLQNLTHYALPQIFENSRTLRRSLTRAEKILWNELRDRRLKGLKFRRQHPAYKYIADFYCHETRLVVEVDGDTHNTEEAKQYDAARTEHLREFGIEVLRFSNEEVFRKLDKVLEQIAEVAGKRTSPPAPSPVGEGE